MRTRVIDGIIATTFFGTVVALMVAGWRDVARSPSLEPGSGALEQVIAARPVVVGLRISLVTLAAYVVGSVAALVLQGRWIVKAGPSGAEVEPARTLDLLRDGNQSFDERLGVLEDSLEEVWDVVAELRTQMEDEEGES